MKRSHLSSLLLLTILAVGFFFSGIPKDNKIESLKAIKLEPIEIQPEIILPGDPIFITINSASKPTFILWDTKRISSFQYEGKTRALIPIDFNEKVLDHKVVVEFENGESLTKNITITPRKKIVLPVGIPEKLGGNTPKAADSLVKNLAEDNRILNTAKTATTILWSKPFSYPVNNVFVTDDYGYDRATVDQTIVHKGTDFRATVGTEVKALNKGIVRIAQQFNAYGNAVVIDHGQGVQSLYMHLSKINVKVGDTIERGQVIGLSGDTGYVEAPHLHISIKINSVSVDPMIFLGFFEKK